jgi:hypothetical protein
MWALLVIFKKPAPRKQTPNGQKITQSGHPELQRKRFSPLLNGRPI